MTYFRSIVQDVIADPLNSTTDNLGPGAIWNSSGSGTSTLGVAGIQVSLKTDQNCTVYVDQSPDNLNWDISDDYDYYASVGNFGVTVQAVNSYVRVRVKNTGLSATTYLRLQTALCPIVEALPRSLSEDGHLKTHIFGIQDEYGWLAENTPVGELRVTTPTRLVGAQFDGATIDPNFWVATVANSATIAQGNDQIVLTSGTNSAGSAKLNSVRRARYVSASPNGFRGVVQLGDTGTVNNTRQWGVAFGATMPTITDGAYFRISGVTFSIVTNKGGSETVVSSGSFNGNLGASYIPSTNATTYEIYWTNSSVWFVVGSDILHTVSAAASPWSNTMSHYVYMDNVNSGNTTSVTLSCRVASVRRLGPLLTQPNSKYQSGTTAGVVCKYGAGNLHSMVISGIVSGSVATLYDNTTGSGNVIWSSGTMTIGNQATNLPYPVDFKGLPFFVGLTLVVTTQNSNCLVVYE